MKTYQQILLYIYPKLERFIGDIQTFIHYKAVHSHQIQLKVENNIAKMLDALEKKEQLIAAKQLLKKIFDSFSQEERYILEYKYFRRKDVLKQEYKNYVLDCSSRTYYRKQKRVETKVHAVFSQHNLDEQWFLNTFSSIPSVIQLYDCLKQGRLQLADKRRQREFVLRQAS